MKILIAEDDPTSKLLLTRTLEKDGHEVVGAVDGISAWRLFQSESPNLVITDWMMPGMDGLELCRAIRASGRAEYPYIFILTALTGKGRFLQGMDAGADDYLTKPFDPDELAARLRVAMRILGLKQEVSRLEGLLPICSYCKRIRNDGGDWTNVETYVAKRSEASFTHSICPTCFTVEVEADLKRLETGA
jgi:DNA-binding response OmpR family regulator